MEAEIKVENAGRVWEIVPVNGLAGALLGILFLYVIFRHMLFVLMFMDLIIGWLRKFAWFPKEGKRKRTIIHWAVAWGVFAAFMAGFSWAGWLQFIPK